MVQTVFQKVKPIITGKTFYVFLIGLGAVLRALYLFELPLYTTDHLRNLGYGLAFWQWGFAVYQLTPFDFSPLDVQFLWANHHYTYPAMTLCFFAMAAKIWPAVFFGKMVLTLFDLCSTWVIYKATQDRWTALLFWLNPISIWFTAREGQFEGLVILLMVLAVYFHKKNKPVAMLFWGLAIQTKLFPVFLAPYFGWTAAWKKPRQLAAQAGWGLASFLPSILAQTQGRYLFHLFGAEYVPRYNPMSWNLFDAANFPYTPQWVVALHAVAGVLFLFAGLWAMKKTGRWEEILPALIFVGFVKMNVLGQFWYMMLVPAFCLPVSHTKWRRVLFALALLFGVKSIYSILWGAIGYQNPADAMMILQYNFWGL
jgi:hypothetical protein